jgi:5-(carboxyamino)imidazole ribonucleotide mutase
MKQKTKIQPPLVGIIMGSDSDWPVLKGAAEACTEFGVACDVRVVSAHRTPDDMARYAKTAAKRGLRVIIAGAGGAAHLPGMVASHTCLPVIGVPVESKHLNGLDSLLSIVQMPGGVPVATVAIGGGRNAGLLAVQILATGDERLRSAIVELKKNLAKESRAKNRRLRAEAALIKKSPANKLRAVATDPTASRSAKILMRERHEHLHHHDSAIGTRMKQSPLQS